MRRPNRTRTPRRRFPAVLATAVTLGVLTSGCTSDEPDDDAAAPATPAAPTETTSPASTQPTSEAAQSTPLTSATTSTQTPPADTTSSAPPSSPSASAPPDSPDSGATGDDSSAARAHRSLIPKAKLPGFNEQWVWDGAETLRSGGRTPPGVCLQASLTAIGGFAEARRDYTSSLSADAHATVLSAVFPDPQTTRTAVSVLSAWQDRCQRYATQELGYRDVRVTETETEPTRVGPGVHWLVSHLPGPDRESRWFDAEGYVVDGDTLTYVVIRVAGQDYNYEAGQSPVEQTLRVAGKRLQRTR